MSAVLRLLSALCSQCFKFLAFVIKICFGFRFSNFEFLQLLLSAFLLLPAHSVSNFFLLSLRFVSNFAFRISKFSSSFFPLTLFPSSQTESLRLVGTGWDENFTILGACRFTHRSHRAQGFLPFLQRILPFQSSHIGLG